MSENHDANYYPYILQNFESFGTTHYGTGTGYTDRGASGLEEMAYKFVRNSSGIHIYVKSAGRYKVYGKGSVLMGTVESGNQNAYPSNGEQDEYWYVSKGIK